MNGTGFRTTKEGLKNEGYPLSNYLSDWNWNEFTLLLRHPTEPVTPQVEIRDWVALTMNYCETPKSMKGLMAFLKLKDRKHFVAKVLEPLIDSGLLKRTIPEKPKSRFQKYVAAKKGGAAK